MKKKMKNNMTRKSFSRGRLKVRMMFLGTCIGRYGPVDYSSVFGGIGSHSHRVFGHFVRGSREISPAPSLIESLPILIQLGERNFQVT